MRNHYQILGINETASEKEIKDAYRKLAKRLHPDLNPQNREQAEKEFQQVSAAYNILSNKDSRNKYDQELKMQHMFGGIGQGGTYSSAKSQYGNYQQGNGGNHNFFSQSFDLNGFNSNAQGRFFNFDLSSIFNMFNMQQQKSTRIEVSVSFREAALGTQKKVQFQGRILNIKIPAGAETGMIINVPKKGENQTDLQLELKVEDDPIFRRVGLDIHINVKYKPEYSWSKIMIPTLHGPVEINIDQLKPGKKLRLKGQGIRTAQKQGDQYIIVN